MREQDRYLHARGALQRRDLVEELLVLRRIADGAASEQASIDIPAGVRIVREHEREIADPGDAHGAAEELGRPDRAHQRRVAAIAAAVDADALRLSDALRGKPLRTGRDVVLHRPAPLAIAGELERLAEAVGAAELRLQDRVAARCQQLDDRVPLPAIAHDRSAVHEDDRWQITTGAGGQREVCRDLEPVERLVAHDPHGAHGAAVDLRLARLDLAQRMRRQIEQIPGARIDVARRRDEDTAGAQAAAQDVRPPGQGGIDRLLDPRPLRIEPMDRGLHAECDDADVVALPALIDIAVVLADLLVDVADVLARVAGKHLLQRVFLERIAKEGRRVASLGREHGQRPAIGRQRGRRPAAVDRQLRLDRLPRRIGRRAHPVRLHRAVVAVGRDDARHALAIDEKPPRAIVGPCRADACRIAGAHVDTVEVAPAASDENALVPVRARGQRRDKAAADPAEELAVGVVHVRLSAHGDDDQILAEPPGRPRAAADRAAQHLGRHRRHVEQDRGRHLIVPAIGEQPLSVGRQAQRLHERLLERVGDAERRRADRRHRHEERYGEGDGAQSSHRCGVVLRTNVGSRRSAVARS